MKIIIKGDAQIKVDDFEEWDIRFAEPEELEVLDGTTCQDNFMEYFHLWRTPELEPPMLKALDKFAYMYFQYDPSREKMVTYTVYQSNRKLLPEEEQALIDYTSGQWSDGIGEGFEQHPVQDRFYISAWFPEQVRTLEYKD